MRKSLRGACIGTVSLVTALGCGASQPAPTSSAPTAPSPNASQSVPVPASTGPQKLAYPVAAKKPVTTGYGALNVTDDYQWMEPNADPAVKEWVAAENALTRSVLDAIPNRAAVHARVLELQGGRTASYGDLVPRGKVIFAQKHQPPKQQPFLVALTTLDDTKSERIVLDPNAIDPSGKTTIDFYAPSLDGKLVAVSLSEGGSEEGSLHVFDVATGKPKGDVVPSAQKGTGGGSVTWNKDGTGFWYTRYPHKGERPDADLDFYQQIYFHKLGTPIEKDTYALGKDAPRIAEIELETSDDGKLVLAKVKSGDGGDQEFHLLGASGKWEKIASIADNVRSVSFGRDGMLYMVVRKDAPHGKVVRVPAAKPVLASAELVLPPSDAVISQIAVGKTRLYASDLVGGPSQIRIVPIEQPGSKKGIAAPSLVEIAKVSTVGSVVALEGDDMAFLNESYVEPPAWFHFHAKDGKATKTALAETSNVDFADVEVVRETCTSKDGTKVPLSVVRPRGAKLDGSHPVFLTAYGGYGINRQPHFRPITRMWLDQGGVFAEANLRGGGEFGDEWHHDGYLTKKQNVFDDFAGCMKAAVDLGYTRPEKLAIYGGSNGGLLMGAALTQHPDMMKAVVSLFGIYDMVRVETEPNGAYNVTEFGTMKDPEQAKALLAYSPYHNVKDATAYPATLFLHGDNDPRVAPWQSRKMASRLQVATSSSAPILLRTNGGQGHVGASLDAVVERDTDIYTFLFQQLGVEMKQPK